MSLDDKQISIIETLTSAGEKRPLIRFLRTTDCPTVSCYPLLSMDRAMEQAGIQSFSCRPGRAQLFVAKALSRLHLMRNLHRSSAGPVFVAFMGFTEHKTFPFSCWTELVPYCFDCWPSMYQRWTSFFRRHRVRLAFFSARQSAQHFAAALPNMKSVWLPEATDPSEYFPAKPWVERDIHVLELGRKNDHFHSRIEGPLAAANRLHLFEQVKGQIVFPDRAGFLDGLARSKISICFPCSQTHPERSGSVETVTHRYFESMASKCLVVGHAPRELIDLFGYNPVIEVQAGHEFEQLQALLNEPNFSRELIERNFRRLLEVGTWKSRVETILKALNEATIFR